MEVRKKYNYLLIVYVILTLFASIIISCEPSVEVIMMEVAEDPEIEPPEVIIEANEPKEEKIMELKPIAVYAKYAVTDSQVFGLNGKLKELINLEDTEGKLHPFNDFFIVGGDLYFQVKETIIDNSDPEDITSEEVTHYFSQVDNEIAEFVSAGDYPEKPASDYVNMSNKPFEIIKFDYEGQDTSRVIKNIYDEAGKIAKSLPTGYLKIDGFLFTNDGLWFSVPETIQTRLKGLYFYPNGGNIVRVIESGRIW